MYSILNSFINWFTMQSLQPNSGCLVSTVPHLFWITFAIQSLKWKRPINFCVIKHVQSMCRYTLPSTKVICLGAYLIQSHLNTCPWFSSKWFFTVTKKLSADRTQLSVHELFCLQIHFLVSYLKHIIHVNKVKIYSF